MAVFCSECGKDNAEGSKFCQSCGTAIPTAPPAAAAATAPMAAAYQQPYQQPYQPAAYQQPYQQPYQPVAAPQVVVKSGGASLVTGGVIIIIAALLIIVGTFTPWITSSGPYGGSASMSGWEARDVMENPIFDWGGGKPLFSGLCSLIAGCLMAGAALLVILVKNKGMAGLALFFSLLALAMAGTNTYSILSVGEGSSLGYGMILFLIGSVGGMVGGFVGMTG